jgi:hypothetical protein
LEEKPIFFARKFEAIINQEIINNVDTFLYGPYPKGRSYIMSYQRVPHSASMQFFFYILCNFSVNHCGEFQLESVQLKNEIPSDTFGWGKEL